MSRPTCPKCGGAPVKREEHTVESTRTESYWCAQNHFWKRVAIWKGRGVWVFRP